MLSIKLGSISVYFWDHGPVKIRIVCVGPTVSVHIYLIYFNTCSVQFHQVQQNQHPRSYDPFFIDPVTERSHILLKVFVYKLYRRF